MQRPQQIGSGKYFFLIKYCTGMEDCNNAAAAVSEFMKIFCHFIYTFYIFIIIIYIYVYIYINKYIYKNKIKYNKM